MSSKKQLKKAGFIWSIGQERVLPGRNDMVVGMWNKQLHCVCSQKVGVNECLCWVSFLFFMQSATPTYRMAPPFLGVSPHSNSHNEECPHRQGQRFVSKVILYPVMSTININTNTHVPTFLYVNI